MYTNYFRLKAQVDLQAQKVNGLKLNLAIARRDDNQRAILHWAPRLAAAEADLVEARWILETDPEVMEELEESN